ncbi:hypothetical protein GCM10023188_09980 [Pontibacter saemangeumensis]|uniref:DUF2382 domain-containing protein n=2 Tax=Pontibacter saemangeumensis TaxID=1084525 RepID=A0ABP8LCN2_9BACT
MSHTVVGVFDSSTEAQTAVQHLVSNGITRDRIDVSPQTAANSPGLDRDRDEDNDSIGAFFRNLFGSDERTDHYSKYARNGSVVTVHATSTEEAERAADIMDEDGAVNLDERTTGKGYAAGAAGAAMTDTTRRDLDTTNTDKSIPIIEENLRVGKREVETGGVRVRSRIVEKPVEEHLRLREEHVHVERTPVNRAATPADLNSFKEGDISLTEHAEIPMVDKEARVVEEVRIGKDVEEHVENIHETVRKTDVDIDKLSSDELRNRRTDMDADANLTDEELRRRRMNTGPDRPKTL